jgi:hypothetical protein
VATRSTQPEQDEITTSADLGFTQRREVEVDAIAPVMEQSSPGGRVIVRMNTTLDDFTYGDPNVHYKLEAGKRYEMPRHIATYLEALGYLWH